MSNVAGSSTGAVSDLTIEAVKGWSTERLNKFLKARLKNIDVHINTITETQQVDGDSFLDLTAVDFEMWANILTHTMSFSPIIPNTYLFLCFSFQ
ncbi:hypothetical protein RclHR1_05630011 [Rhizophagus clarus]|uniref:SAM domain-containing protein n=1 Tax=Rhizophagus clarus TaxID=94130 RepID=A0A2Z6RPB8_9GLOM|nr:hypothetical protein RclHR1_05630011 [Rhizophagus clarus]